MHFETWYSRPINSQNPTLPQAPLGCCDFTKWASDTPHQFSFVSSSCVICPCVNLDLVIVDCFHQVDLSSNGQPKIATTNVNSKLNRQFTSCVLLSIRFASLAQMRRAKSSFAPLIDTWTFEHHITLRRQSAGLNVQWAARIMLATEDA